MVLKIRNAHVLCIQGVKNVFSCFTYVFVIYFYVVSIFLEYGIKRVFKIL